MIREMSSHQWSRILQFLRGCPDVYVGHQEHCRRFISGVLWIARTGAQWRELPERYGRWNTVYQRFRRWAEKGIWQRMHEHVADDPDLEAVIPDSTIVRAHPCAAGAPVKRGAKGRNTWAEAGVGSAPRFMSAWMPWATRSGSH